MSSFFPIDNQQVSTNIFSKNIREQTQNNLFGAPKEKLPNEEKKNIFNSSLFQKENNNSIFTNKNLFNNENQNNSKKEENNIFKNSTLFTSGLSNNENKFIFGKKNENELNNKKEDSSKKPQMSIFNTNQDNIKNENDKDIKNPNINEITKEDKKQILELFGPKNKEENKLSFGPLQPNKDEKKLFQFEENENKNNKNIIKFEANQSQNNKKIFEKDENENETNKKLFQFSMKGNEDSKLFQFNGDEKGNNKTLFHFNIDNKEENKQPDKINNDNKEEKSQTNIINNEDKEIKNIFGTPKKEPEKLIIPKIDDKQEDKQDDKKIEFEINTNIKTNNINNQDNINKLSYSSTQRLEDNEDVQKALKNLYFSDILLPKKSYNQSFVENNNNNKNKLKRNRPIDFTLLIEIEGIINMNNKEINMTCKSNETMSNLMKQVKILVKKKYKINKEQNDLNDFEFNLIKNTKKLPINEREIIGDHIRNKDIIIVSINHQNSDLNEEKEEEEKTEEENKDEFEKKILCPKDKLPILNRPGYYMNPNEYDISRMTIDEINNVNNFEIYNENGKIHFDSAVSLYGINFDKLFNIGHDLIEYEKGEWCHSPRGTNFNIPATITLYNIYPNINLSSENSKRQYLEFLKEKCQKYFYGTFISFDFDKGVLKYKIPFFY